LFLDDGKRHAEFFVGGVYSFHFLHGLLHHPQFVAFHSSAPCDKVFYVSDLIPVTVKGVVPTPNGWGVFLCNDGKTIAIFVDGYVGMAISMFLAGEKKPRPLTHDLMVAMMTGLGARVQKVVINDLKGDVYYARVFLYQENELGKNFVELDARPSDSIALAVQQKCPILVARPVWEKAEDMTEVFQQAMESLSHSGQGNASGPSTEDEDDTPDPESEEPNG
jgi:bifunctional DNase/RNase